MEKEKEQVLHMKFLLILHFFCSMNQLPASIRLLLTNFFRSFKELLRYMKYSFSYNIRGKKKQKKKVSLINFAADRQAGQ